MFAERPRIFNFGQPGGEIQETLALLEDLHLPIHPTTISRIRSGDMSGRRVVDSIFAARALTELPSYEASYIALLRIIKTGLGSGIRINRSSANYNHRYLSEGYLGRLSVATDIKQTALRSLLHAARVISVYATLSNPDQLSPEFLRMQQTLYSHMSTPHYSSDNLLERLEQKSITNPAEWYQFVYSVHRGRWWGKLTPYEMEYFYAAMKHLVVTEGCDQFTSNVLMCKAGYLSQDRLAQITSEETGIPIYGRKPHRYYFRTVMNAELPQLRAFNVPENI